MLAAPLRSLHSNWIRTISTYSTAVMSGLERVILGMGTLCAFEFDRLHSPYLRAGRPLHAPSLSQAIPSWISVPSWTKISWTSTSLSWETRSSPKIPTRYVEAGCGYGWLTDWLTGWQCRR
jgi:hypothetical protein